MRGYEGNKIKAEIQKKLREVPMSPTEIAMHFKLDKRVVSNFLTTLKKYKLISWHPDFKTGHTSLRKYYAHYDGEDFLKLSQQVNDSKYRRMAEKKSIKKLETKKTNPYTQVYSMDDDIFKKAMSQQRVSKKSCAWLGYGGHNEFI